MKKIMPGHTENTPRALQLTLLASALLLTAGAGSSNANITPETAALEANAESQVVSLRLGQTPGRTRLVFDLSDPASFNLRKLDNPQRVIVELSDASSAFDPSAISVRGTPIKRIEAPEAQDQPLRYVINLAQDVSPRLFALKPYLNNGHRLVLDLYQPQSQANTGVLDAPGSDTSGEAPLIAANTAPRPKPVSPRSATKTETPAPPAPEGELSGYFSIETRLFASDAQFEGQDEHSVSVALEPQYYIDWADGAQRFALRPFFRYDANDDERSHIDLRELYWRMEYNDFIVKLGVDVVFWGVAESQHLIDVINQTDFVENIDGEDRLGQPMLNVDYSSPWGTWQGYILPYFRERTFPGENGRLRTNPYVDTDDAIYESGKEEEHIDFAVRWSHYFGDWDVGLAHFSGTSREPVLVPSGTVSQPRLSPLYLQIDQTSLDVQATKGAWLWKLEALYNSNRLEDYYAAVGGFEYTWFGAINEVADLGWLLEYHFDERDESALTPLQDDIFFGVRYTGNDVAGTRVLAGVIVDVDSQSTFGNFEAVRRLGEDWTVTLEARIFSNVDDADLMRFWEEDDYIELQLSRFF